ncbi:MAG: hypothetical protein JKP98_02520 [Rhodobacteraceae bacterium]|nr:hypothetical protein [Paracoccaceae bacterium]
MAACAVASVIRRAARPPGPAMTIALLNSFATCDAFFFSLRRISRLILFIANPPIGQGAYDARPAFV